MDKDEPDYEVGYGKPPEHSRFKKGESGNPKGRPKGALSFAHQFRRAAAERIWVNLDGKRRQITKLEALAKQLFNKAAKGESRAMQLVVTLKPLLEDPTAAMPEVSTESEREALQVLYSRFAATPGAQPVVPSVSPPPPDPPAKRAPLPAKRVPQPAAKRTPPVPEKRPAPVPAKKSLPMKTTPALKKLQEKQND